MTTKLPGGLKATHVAVSELKYRAQNMAHGIEVHAGLVSTKTGATHAWIEGRNVKWSQATMGALQELLRQVERDILHAHFDGPLEDSDPEQDSGGLAEHLGDPPPL